MFFCPNEVYSVHAAQKSNAASIFLTTSVNSVMIAGPCIERWHDLEQAGASSRGCTIPSREPIPSDGRRRKQSASTHAGSLWVMMRSTHRDLRVDGALPHFLSLVVGRQAVQVDVVGDPPHPLDILGVAHLLVAAMVRPLARGVVVSPQGLDELLAFLDGLCVHGQDTQPTLVNTHARSRDSSLHRRSRHLHSPRTVPANPQARHPGGGPKVQ